MRLIISLVLALQCAAASAEVTCDQLASIAYTTQKLRDQGHSLAAVLAETDKLESTGKFTAADLGAIRSVVERAFRGGSRVPYELLQACKDKLGK